MQTPESPPTLKLPKSVDTPYLDRHNNPNYIPLGNNISRRLFSMDECPGAPIKKKSFKNTINFSSKCNLFGEIDEGYETPDDQPTISTNTKPQRKKK